MPTRMLASAIVPAYNEGATVGGVVCALRDHPLIGEVIVVSDGSSDDTAHQARQAGARVIELARNCGKAAAMSRGVRAARSDVLLFIDADILGLSATTITRLVAPVMTADCEMFVGICDRRVYWMNRLLRYTPILSGERALRRTVWEQVPATYLRNFQIEIALNYFAKSSGARMRHAVMPGLHQVTKERKRGRWPGLWQRTLMIRDILLVATRLYVFQNARLLFGAATAPRLQREQFKTET